MNKREELRLLLEKSNRGDLAPIKTVSKLAEIAKISRAALYRYYPDIIRSLKESLSPSQPLNLQISVKKCLNESQYRRTKDDIESISQAYIKLLSEYEFFKLTHQEMISEKEYRVRVLEEKLARYEKPRPRIVK